MEINVFSVNVIYNCINFHWQIVINMNAVKNNNVVLLSLEVSVFCNPLITQMIADILIAHTFAYKYSTVF
jgi:hypothetical protein